METPTDPDGRLEALGNELIEVHLWLRDELARFREDLDAHLDGGVGRPRELRTHCLTFCSALRRHHAGEDGEGFPALADQFPELRPVLVELGRDHEIVAGMLRRLEELTGGFQARSDLPEAQARSVRAELDGLAALLESHFGYEERKLVAALNSTRASGKVAWLGR